eukprot:INCI11016.1.p2 GENE.INCI11016.1~~INCI11016.1.p2  ORF type:complete len:113 (-),score=18.38 INCI11016.1:55-393(-)
MADHRTQDARIKKLQEDLTNCHNKVVYGQWTYFLLGMAVGVPMALVTKSYYPFIATGTIGSIADFQVATQSTECDGIEKKLNLALAGTSTGIADISTRGDINKDNESSRGVA